MFKVAASSHRTSRTCSSPSVRARSCLPHKTPSPFLTTGWFILPFSFACSLHCISIRPHCITEKG